MNAKTLSLWLIVFLLLAGCSPTLVIQQSDPAEQQIFTPVATLASSARPTHIPAASATLGESQSAPANTLVTSTVPLTAEACVNNTRSEAECKDCCDNLDADSAGRKACRDACPGHDFSQNSDFITVEVTSVLGPEGDYSACTSAGSQDDCKICCDSSTALQNGDRRFCRDACNQMTDTASSSQNPSSGQQASQGRTPPQEVIQACTRKSEQEACEFTSPKGAETGVCKTAQNQLACSPQRGSTDGKQPGKNGKQPGEKKPGTENTANAGQPAYNVEQAISDKAQGMTIAFDALAFLTGDLGADSFFPPGKVADFWGFQYLRDNDSSQMGHAGDFLTSAAMNMLSILTLDQRAELVALAESQVDLINEYGYKRFVLMDAFRRLLEGNMPAGATGLNEEAVKAYSAELYRLDGEISFKRAQVMGNLLNSMDATQRAYLDSMVGKGMLEWSEVEEPSDIRGLDRDVKVAVMTYAADMFSWYAGSVDADVYFCPERHGTYFGSFYLKDIPAMDNPEYAIPTDLTGNMGDALLAALTPDQAEKITGLVDIQRPYLLGIVDTRRQISIELRKFLAGETADNATVLSLMGKYGELDGEIIYNLARDFALVNQSLTDEQKAQLMALRQQLLGNLIYPTGAYLYSQPIDMPAIPNSDFLFAIQ